MNSTNLKRYLIVIWVLIISACALVEITPEEPQLFIIDVRTAGEFNGGHLSDALNIPYDVIGEQIAGVTTDKSAEIIVYCSRGGRAEHAKDTLNGMGYTNVTNAGGYQEILESGRYK